MIVEQAVIVEQANVSVDKRFARSQAIADRLAIDFHTLGEVIRSLRSEVESEKAQDFSTLETPAILLCSHKLAPLFQAVGYCEHAVSRFIDEHRANLSKADCDDIQWFVGWLKGLEKALSGLRDEKLNRLEGDLRVAGMENDGASSDWDVTLSDGLEDDASSC